MNISFKLKCLMCCLTLVAFGSIARAQDAYVAVDGDKKAPQSVPTDVAPSNVRPFDPVPEPSTVSLILLGLGTAGLAMKLRKRA